MFSEQKKYSTLELIGQIFEGTKNSDLNEKTTLFMDEELGELSEYFRLSKNEALFVSIIFALNCGGNPVNLNELARHFGCNPIKLLKYNSNFDSLYKKGIVLKRKPQFGDDLIIGNEELTIDKKIVEAIINNKSMPKVERCSFKNTFEVLGKIYELIELRYDEVINTEQLFNETAEIISSNSQFPLIRYILDLQLNKMDNLVLLNLIWELLSSSRKVYLTHLVGKIYDKPSKNITYVQNIIAKNNDLIINNLIELQESSFLDDLEIKITNTTSQKLKDFGFNIIKHKKGTNINIIKPDNIKYKSLFYNENEIQQLKLLESSLEEVKFKEIQLRLIEKNLPFGITCLLSGPPGVGKTEFALQLAKSTNRNVFKVDISQSKSMWYGESEKIVKQLFIDYKELCETSDKTPILFFNEADAIITKRTDNSKSNVGNTENTIQNIILEELENFEGIFIATTNLASNFDAAFERRFLFKIDLKQPEILTKEQIWKSKIKGLLMNEYKVLSEKFNFSGGEIENVIRKCAIQEILYDKEVDFKSVLQFCNSEKMINNYSARIGFNKI